MKRDYQHIVIGLGGIGSGAAYWLSRRSGGDTLGIEQFELGHVRGSSQDHSRIIRYSYHRPFYVRLAKEAFRAWAEVESDAGEQLIFQTGGLDLWPEGAAIPMSDYTTSLAECGVPFDLLDAREIRRRWPAFRLADDVRGLFQSNGGIAAAAKCNAAHQRLAREHGATLLERTPVQEVRSVDGEFEVVTQDAIFRSGSLVIAAAAWTNRILAHFGRPLPITVTQEQVTYFVPASSDLFALGRFPIWIWMDEPSFYGFPIFGEPAVKVAQDVGGRVVTAESRTFEPDPENFSRVERFVRETLPDALGSVLYTKTCLYALTPDRDFVIDTIPGHPRCAIAIGGGHGFKFASVIGKILAHLATGEPPLADLAPFSFARPVLAENDPPKNFLV